MRCTCGLENNPDAKFCQSCGTILGGGAGSVVSNADVSSSATLTQTENGKASARPRSHASMTIVVVVVVVVAAGYWWLYRSPNGHMTDNSGLYPINVNGKYGFMDRSGKTVITPQFDGTHGFSEGLAAVRIGTKYGFINTKGEVVITPQFDAVFPFSEGLAAVQVGTKFGYINTKGLVSITPQFDEVRSFHNGRAAVKICCGPMWTQLDTKVGHTGTNRYGFIDKDGKYVGTPVFLFVQPDYSAASRQSDDVSLVRTVNDRVGVMDRSGKIVIADTADELGWSGFVDGLAPAATGGKWGYLDTKGKWAIEPQYEKAFGFKDGLATVKVGGRSGLIDHNGTFVVNPQYDFIFGVSEGYAIFESGKGSITGCQDCTYHGFINTKGQVVVEAKFVERADANNGWSSPVRPFSEGLAAVKTDEGWGFIDPTGRMVISPQFDTAGSFQNDLAFVTVLGKEAYITKTGAFVVDPFPGTSVLAEKARVAAEAARSPSPSNFVGAWWLEPGGGYLRIIEAASGQLVLTEGVETNWRISWSDTGVNMNLVSGRLQGEITSYNFRPTHGAEFVYRLTVELLANGKLKYNVESSLGNETRGATKLPPAPSIAS